MVFRTLKFLTFALLLIATKSQKSPSKPNSENEFSPLNHLDIYNIGVENLLMFEIECIEHKDNGTFYSTGSGAGYLLPDTPYIITANHNLPNDNETHCKFYIRYYSQNIHIPFSIVYQNAVVDTAILITNQYGINNTRLGKSSELAPLDSIFIIGNALGKGKPTITRGYMISYPENTELWYSNPTSSGDSGGIILDEKGDILGIHFGRTLNVAKGVPIDFIKPELFARIDAYNSVYAFVENSYKTQTSNTFLSRHFNIHSIINIPESICEKLKFSMGLKECGVLITDAPQALKFSMILKMNNRLIRTIKELDDECRITENHIKRKDITPVFSMITKPQLGNHYSHHRITFVPD